ncbi:cyclopropane-fatty-acyl-phospholipid synthase family protein [Limnohabitans sp. INBF002]|uniref:SAM-dependent methyltransferase n=1 Tax=Limnohabitans sp. INBF002 TaxID=2986280 RepID=UPI002377A813|nr:cyclopropane-fatty-acyl-phospholipid synthase family protein [Limnohabitans sp. INBF002]BDU54258.1 cyclopropane-fatty-acyl-phospholipid synthase [Limnohabitans sp. INBF002]
MTSSTTSAPVRSAPQDMPAAARRVLSLLQRLQHGTLHVQWPDGSVAQYGAAPATGPALNATLHLHSYAPLTQALKSGDIGFAESYIAGEWTTNNLSELLQLLVANRRDMDELIFGSWLGRLFYRVRHLLHRNTRSNSKKNIHAHYDLGNAFYELWLDPTMNYSSAWFDNDRAKPMAEAQTAKVRRALRMVDAKAGDRILEIGCGWGALAELGGQEFGAHMSGVTLSHEQLAFANQRMQTQGLAATSHLRLQDYRDIDDGPYDAICSIEMLEAVGQEYWPTYFESVARLLKSGGKACIQTIVIDDALFDRYVKSTDFIQQYIFPGGCLPCPREFRAHAERAGLKVVDELAFGLDYAETLRRWRHQFMADKTQVLQLGFDERFIRIWEFYLAYCEAAFEQHNTDVLQFTLVKP